MRPICSHPVRMVKMFGKGVRLGKRSTAHLWCSRCGAIKYSDLDWEKPRWPVQLLPTLRETEEQRLAKLRHPGTITVKDFYRQLYRLFLRVVPNPNNAT